MNKKRLHKFTYNEFAGLVQKKDFQSPPPFSWQDVRNFYIDNGVIKVRKGSERISDVDEGLPIEYATNLPVSGTQNELYYLTQEGITRIHQYLVSSDNYTITHQTNNSYASYPLRPQLKKTSGGDWIYWIPGTGNSNYWSDLYKYNSSTGEFEYWGKIPRIDSNSNDAGDSNITWIDYWDNRWWIHGIDADKPVYYSVEMDYADSDNIFLNTSWDYANNKVSWFTSGYYGRGYHHIVISGGILVKEDENLVVLYKSSGAYTTTGVSVSSTNGILVDVSGQYYSVGIYNYAGSSDDKKIKVHKFNKNTFNWDSSYVSLSSNKYVLTGNSLYSISRMPFKDDNRLVEWDNKYPVFLAHIDDSGSYGDSIYCISLDEDGNLIETLTNIDASTYRADPRPIIYKDGVLYTLLRKPSTHKAVLFRTTDKNLENWTVAGTESDYYCLFYSSGSDNEYKNSFIGLTLWLKPNNYFEYMTTHNVSSIAYSDAQTYDSVLNSQEFVSSIQKDGFVNTVALENSLIFSGLTDDIIITDTFVGEPCIDKPSSEPSLTDLSTSGNLDGTYKYKITYVRKFGNEYWESNPCDDYAEIEVNNSQVQVSVDNDGDEADKVYQIKIYRTMQGGGTFYYLATIDVNGVAGTYTYDDNTSDYSLYIELETNHYCPPKTKFKVEYNKRLWYANSNEYPSRIWFSELNEYHYVSPLNAIDVSPDDGEEITGIIEFKGVLFAFKKSSVWAITGWSSSDITVRRVLKRVGNIYYGALNATDDLIFFWSSYGLELFDGQQLVKPNLSYVIRTFLDNCDFSDQTKIRSAINPEKQQYWLLLPQSGSSDNNTILVYDVEEKYFTIYDFPYNFEYIGNTLYNNQSYIIGSTYDGKIYLLDQNTTDDGANITAYFITNWNDYTDDSIKKTLRRRYVRFSTETTPNILSMYSYKDYDLSTIKYTKDILDNTNMGNKRLDYGLTCRVEATKVYYVGESGLSIYQVEDFVRADGLRETIEE